MPDNFQQTVDLKKKIEPKSRIDPKPQPKPAPKKVKSRAREIDKIYEYKDEKAVDLQEMQKITRSAVKKVDGQFFKRISVIFAVIIIALAGYLVFFNRPAADNPDTGENMPLAWYSVKLVNGDVYYGQIGDIRTNPLELSNVYYNYDQLKKDAAGSAQETNESGIKLVKRGKETYGPSGTMYIYLGQVFIVEPLSDDSKVLNAILDHEK